MVIVADGVDCGCGRKGCFEAYASATALIRMTREAMAKHPESMIHQIAAEQGVDGRTAFTAQKMGDAAGVRRGLYRKTPAHRLLHLGQHRRHDRRSHVC